MVQTAPYMLTVPQQELPEGEFLLPVCTTRQRVLELLSALKRAEIYTELNVSSKIDILEALAYVQNPQDAPCFPPCEEEDTLADDIAQLADGIVTSFQEGGITKALGYAIDSLGRIIVETAKRVISTTILGIGVASILYIIIGGVTVGTVAVGANELVDVVFDTGTGVSKIIEFVYQVAA